MTETKISDKVLYGYTSIVSFCFSVPKAYLSRCGGEKGIASNKLLAKIASAKNKPDRQTLVGSCLSYYLGLHFTCSVTVHFRPEFYLVSLYSLKAGFTYEQTVLICVILFADIGVQIPPRSVPGLMKDLPLKKIKLLGGKLGEVPCFLTNPRPWGIFSIGSRDDV